MRTVLKEIQLLMLVATFLIALALPVKAANKDLLLYLSFDEEGEVAKDETGKTEGGNIIGGVEWVEGRFGKALELDGESGYVEIELTPELIFTEESSFTAELWLKFQEVPDSCGILGTYGPEAVTPFWNLTMLASREFEWGGRDSDSTSAFATVEAPDDGEWHHVAGVRDGKDKVFRLYLDGELVDEVEDPTKNIDNGQGKIWLGNHMNRFWPVTLDEVRIWGVVLSDTEIMKAMDSTIMSVASLNNLSTTWGNIKAH